MRSWGDVRGHMAWAKLVLTDIWRLTFWELLLWEGEEIKKWEWGWG